MINVTEYTQLVSELQAEARSAMTVTSRDIWLLDYELVRDFRTASFVFVCAIVSLLGIGANVVNMIIFKRLGFQETINISLFGLSLSDMLSLVPLLWTSICFNPLLLFSDTVPIYFMEIEHYTGGYPHAVFTRVSGFITVFITLERCLCIAYPMKIKRIMTQKRVTSVIVAIFVIVIASMCQNYFTFQYKWFWNSYRNKTMLTAFYFDNWRVIELATQSIQSSYMIFSFSSVVVCTTIFVWKLNRRSKWRQSATAAAAGSKDSSSDANALRDRQIIKMVVGVAIIFIVSFIPVLLISIAFAVSSDIDIGGKYENLMTLLFSICYPVEAVNATVNILVYYNMMSKYKAKFNSLFNRSPKPVA